MTKYNSYQEAKIANPESDIFFMHNGEYRTGEWIDQYNFGRSSFVLCDPADHCMTVEKFLDDGYKFVEGDLIINTFGNVNEIRDNEELSNELVAENNNSRHALRAAALEDIPTETPEEKEALDLIDTTPHQYEMSKFSGKQRTKVGYVKCEFSREWEAVKYYNEEGELFVIDCNGNYSNVNDISGAWYEVVCKNYDSIYLCIETTECPQQREERERLEAAIELHDLAQDAYFACDGGRDGSATWDKSPERVKSMYFAIVDKTNYRKEKTHGTN